MVLLNIVYKCVVRALARRVVIFHFGNERYFDSKLLTLYVRMLITSAFGLLSCVDVVVVGIVNFG